MLTVFITMRTTKTLSQCSLSCIITKKRIINDCCVFYWYIYLLSYVLSYILSYVLFICYWFQQFEGLDQIFLRVTFYAKVRSLMWGGLFAHWWCFWTQRQLSLNMSTASLLFFQSPQLPQNDGFYLIEIFLSFLALLIFRYPNFLLSPDLINEIIKVFLYPIVPFP